MNLNVQLGIQFVNIDWFTSILLIIYSLLLVFAGKFLLKLIIGCGFGLILSYFMFKLLVYFNIGVLSSLFLAFIVFIIGFFVGWFIFKVTLSVVTGLVLSVFIGYVFNIISETVLFIVITIVCIVVSYLLIETMISFIVVLTGFILFSIGVYSLTGNLILSGFLSIIFLVLLIVSKIAARK